MRSFTTEQINLIHEFTEWVEENAIAATAGGYVPKGKKYVWATPKIKASGYVGGYSTRELWTIFLEGKA